MSTFTWRCATGSEYLEQRRCFIRSASARQSTSSRHPCGRDSGWSSYLANGCNAKQSVSARGTRKGLDSARAVDEVAPNVVGIPTGEMTRQAR